MLKSTLCDYSITYIFVKETILVNNTAAADADAKNTSKRVVFKNCPSFTDSKSEIKNVEIDNAIDIDIVMPMYILMQYSDNCLKICGTLRQYCTDISAVNNNCQIVEFGEANLTD